MKGVLIDFHDSFTFNIVAEFFKLGIELDILKIDCVEESALSYDFYIWGPGPGLVDDYIDFLAPLELMFRTNKPILGICLGHQIIWKFMGQKVVPASRIAHAYREVIDITNLRDFSHFKKSKKILVQRYNSNAVRLDRLVEGFAVAVNDDQELMITYNSRILSYQFHPESVGTDESQIFFQFFKEKFLSDEFRLSI